MNLSKIVKMALCATVYWAAYAHAKYYPQTLRGFSRAFAEYFGEERKYPSEIITSDRRCYALPAGTVRCMVDYGRLPIDDLEVHEFQEALAPIRQKYGQTLGYVGNFAVLPHEQGRELGEELLSRVATEWAFKNGVEAIVLIANPKHETFYRSHGAERILKETVYLRKLNGAPAVLLLLDFSRASPRVQKVRAEYFGFYRDTLGGVPKELAAA